MHKTLSHIFALALGVVGTLALTADAHSPLPAFIQNVEKATVQQHASGKARVRVLAGRDQGSTAAFVAHLEIDAGAGVPEHQDATEEFVFFLSGGGDITIDGKTTAVGAGDLVFMPANAVVSFSAKEDSRVLQVFAPTGPEAKYDAWTAQ